MALCLNSPNGLLLVVLLPSFHLVPASLVTEKLQYNISKSAELNRHVAGGHERLGNTHCSSLSSAALFI